MSFAFPKAEKLCGKREIAELLAHGRRGASGPLRYCVRVSAVERAAAESAAAESAAAERAAAESGVAPVPEAPSVDEAQILISVPKKYFKRAVKRNLLKRRIREAWRLQKDLLLAPSDATSTTSAPVMAGSDRPSRHYDILFTYVSPEVADSATIREAVAAILREIA